MFVPNLDDETLHAGSLVTVTDAHGKKHGGRIATLGVDRRRVEQQLWRRESQPEYGHLIRIELVDAALRPGELVLVRATD